MALNPVALLGVLAPFGIYGVYFFVRTVVYPMIQTRRGYLYVGRFMDNGRIKYFWAKPERDANGGLMPDGKTEKLQFVDGGDLVKGVDGDKYAYVDSPQFTYFDGMKRCALYNSDGQQIEPHSGTLVMAPASTSMLDAIYQRVFNAGKAAAFQEEDKNAKLKFLIMCAAALGAVGAVLMALQTQTKLEELQLSLDVIRSAVVK